MDRYDSDDDEQGRPGAPVDVGRLLHAVLRHWRYIPIAGAVGAILGLAYAILLIKPEFTAHATILWEPHVDTQPSDRELFTQVASIKLDTNLLEVRRRLKLKMPNWQLWEMVTVTSEATSRLINVEAVGGDAKSAVVLTNTVVDVFLDYQRGVVRAQSEEHLRAVDADIEVHQTQLKNARDAYDAFRNQLGVSDFLVETKLAIEKAAALKQQADYSGAEALSEEARQRQLIEETSRQAPTTSAGSSSSNPDALALATARTQLASARSHLAPDHPQIQQLEAQVQALAVRVKSNTNIVQGAVTIVPNAQYLSLQAGLSQSKVTKEAAIERQESLKRLAVEAEKRLQQLSQAQGQATQLLSRMTLLETRLTELESQRVRERDAVRNASPEFRVVMPATPPDYPNPSHRRQIAIKFPIAAVVLMLLAIMAYELRGLRIHTAREAGFWTNTPVIASSTWPRDPSTLGVLVDELSDAAPAVRGMTLVVGGRVNEVPLAREIAYWLNHLTGWSQRAAVGASEPIVGGSTPPMPPSDPGAAPAPSSSGRFALARNASTGERLTTAQAWDGPSNGPALRRAARLADRVLVVVASGSLSVTDAVQLRSRLGRTSGIGVLVVGLNPEFVKLPDRVGEVDLFWRTHAA